MYVICVRLRIVVSNTYCVVFSFLRLVYPMLPVSLDCFFFIATSVFINVYFESLSLFSVYIMKFIYFKRMGV